MRSYWNTLVNTCTRLPGLISVYNASNECSSQAICVKNDFPVSMEPNVMPIFLSLEDAGVLIVLGCNYQKISLCCASISLLTVSK